MGPLPGPHRRLQIVLSFLDLVEVQLYGRGASENGDRHMQAVLLVVDLFDHTAEVVEWSIDDTDDLAGFEYGLGRRFFTAGGYSSLMGFTCLLS